MKICLFALHTHARTHLTYSLLLLEYSQYAVESSRVHSLEVVHSKATSDGSCRPQKKLLCVWYGVTNAVANCPNAFNCVRKPQAFLSDRLLTIQHWLWFCTNNSTVIWATRSVIAARADFLTLCCCDGDGRGRRQSPPHEPFQIGVGCVCLLVGGCLHFSFSQTLHVPLWGRDAFVNPLIFDPDAAWKYQVRTLWLSVSLSLYVCNFSSLWLITGIHSDLLIL